MAQSIKDIGISKLQSLLGDGLISQLAPSLINGALGLTGYGDSPLLNTPVIRDGSAYSESVNFSQQRAMAAARNISSTAENSRYRQWAYDAAQQTMSRDKFLEGVKNRSITGFGANDYDRYISYKAQGIYNNRAMRLLYKQTPDYDETAAAGMNRMAANAIQRGMYTPDENGNFRTNGNVIRQATEFFRGMYGGTFRSKDYGNFREGSVNALGEYFTKNSNVLGNDFDSDSIREARSRFEKKLQGMTRALEPLKDMFGEDIPSMIKAVEAISKTSMSGMSEGQVRAVTQQLQRSMNSSMYSLEEYSRSVQLVQQQLRAMGASDSTIINSSGSLGASIAAVTGSTAFVAPGVTTEKAKNFAGNFVGKTGSGKGYDRQFNLAFAAWKDMNRNGTMEEFSRLMNDQIANGARNPLAALNAITGGRYRAEDLESYSTTSAFQKAQREGMGATLNAEAAAANNVDKYIRRVAMDRNGSFSRMLASEYGMDPSAIDERTRAAMASELDILYQDNVGAMGMDDEAFKSYYEKLNPNASPETVRAMTAMHRHFMNDEGAEEYKNTVTTRSALRQHKAEEQREKKRQRASAALNDNRKTNFYDFFMKGIGSGNLDAYIKEAGKNDDILQFFTDDATRADAIYAMNMAAKAGLTGDAYESAVKDMMLLYTDPSQSDNTAINLLRDEMAANRGEVGGFENNYGALMDTMKALGGADKEQLNDFLRTVSEEAGPNGQQAMKAEVMNLVGRSPEEINKIISVRRAARALGKTAGDDQRILDSAKKDSDRNTESYIAAKRRSEYRAALEAWSSGGAGDKDLDEYMAEQGFGIRNEGADEENIEKWVNAGDKDSWNKILGTDTMRMINSARAIEGAGGAVSNLSTLRMDDIQEKINNGTASDEERDKYLNSLYYKVTNGKASAEERAKFNKQLKSAMAADREAAKNVLSGNGGKGSSSDYGAGKGGGGGISGGLEAVLSNLMNVLKTLFDYVQGKNATGKVEGNTPK